MFLLRDMSKGGHIGLPHDSDYLLFFVSARLACLILTAEELGGNPPCVLSHCETLCSWPSHYTCNHQAFLTSRENTEWNSETGSGTRPSSIHSVGVKSYVPFYN